MKDNIIRNYAYHSPDDPYGDLWITEGQNFGGYLGGVIIERSDEYKPLGHVANARSFPYHVRYAIVEPGAGVEEVKAAAEQLEIEGARFLASSGGALGKYQQEVAKVVDLPTYMTPLIQLKWIRVALKSSEKVLILSDLSAAEADEVFSACNIAKECYDDCVFIQVDKETMTADALFDYIADSNIIPENNIRAVLIDTQLFAGRDEEFKERFGLYVWNTLKLMRYVSKAVGQVPREGFL